MKSKPNIKVRRGGRGRGRGGEGKGLKDQSTMKIIGNNIASLTGKAESLTNLISSFKPAVIILQETKLYKVGKYKAEGYCVFESLRNEKEGGGLMTLVHQKLNPVFIPILKSANDKIEKNILTIEADTDT